MQASACRQCFAACSFSECVHNEGMKGRHKITKDISRITQLNETPLTTTHFPSNPFFNLSISQHEY